jgi:hypothetical protein
MEEAKKKKKKRERKEKNTRQPKSNRCPAYPMNTFTFYVLN